MVAGPFAAVAGLLIVAGIMKRGVLGGAEIAVGAYALVRGDRAGAAILAVLYLSFAVFVLARWWRSGGTASCECFGATTTRATPTHAIVDAACAAVAVAALVSPPGSLARVLSDQPVAGVPFALATAAVGYLTFTVMTAQVARP
jgi:hypothetical protein